MRAIIGEHFYSYIVIKLFKNKKFKVVARITLIRYRKKPRARTANQIAGNHKITLVVHK